MVVVSDVRELLRDVWRWVATSNCSRCGVAFEGGALLSFCRECEEFLWSTRDAEIVFDRYKDGALTREQFIQFRDKILADARIKDEIHKQRQVARLKKRWQVK